MDRARIYVCGVTPYDVTHLGHAATYVWVDALTAVLRDSGITPTVCRNVTDVDDVLTAAAARAGTANDTFAYLQQYDFDRDMAALRVARPQHEPRARHHVDQVVAIAAALVATDAAYVAGGGVYFPGKAVAETAGLTPEEALRLATEYGGRPDDPHKRHSLDAAIWQGADDSELAWDSPWGPGRPGWHAGCSAMVMSTYGSSLDIHAGGADLYFPHHAFEAAIAEALTGVTPYARQWFRAGIVGIDGAKMAKSTGNLILVDDLLQDYSATAVRLMLLDRLWSRSWDYTPALLDAAAMRLDALRTAAGRSASDTAPVAAVRTALRNDLDVTAAIDIAIETGGTAAQRLVSLLRLE
jgi:cysteinyl-tRNA synthetase